jgi:hypothetical protein
MRTMLWSMVTRPNELPIVAATSSAVSHELSTGISTALRARSSAGSKKQLMATAS